MVTKDHWVGKDMAAEGDEGGRGGRVRWYHQGVRRSPVVLGAAAAAGTDPALPCLAAAAAAVTVRLMCVA